MQAQDDQPSSTLQENLKRLAGLWQRQRLLVLRALILLIIGINLAAAAFPGVADFLDRQEHLSFAIVFLVVLLVFEALGERAATSRVEDRTRALGHYSELRPYLAQAFGTGIVDIDIAAYSSETFYSVLTEFFQGVVGGTLPVRRLRIRLLVPDCTIPMAVPCVMDTRREDPEYKRITIERNERFADQFETYEQAIRRRLPDADVRFETRTHPLSPLFKLIIINNVEGFFGIYPIEETHMGDMKLWDFRGERTRYVGMRMGGTRLEADMLESCRKWFDSVWNNLAAGLD